MSPWSQLLDGTDLQVYSRTANRGSDLAITFDYSSQPSSPPYLPGAAALEELGFDHIHVRSPRDIWYQTPELEEVARVVAPIRRAYDYVMSYGNSMGAYGALLTSGMLNVDRVVAFAPQFTIDTARMPEELRWAHVAKDLNFICDEMQTMISRRAEKFIIFDPRSVEDVRHVRHFDGIPNVLLVKIPFCSHLPAQFLKQAGVLDQCLKSLWLDEDPRPTITRLRRGGRRKSPRYFYELAFGLARRRDIPNAVRAVTKAYVMSPDSLESLEAFLTVFYHDPAYFALNHILLRLLAVRGPSGNDYESRADDLLKTLIATVGSSDGQCRRLRNQR